MRWTIEIALPARKQLDKLDAPVRERIADFLTKRLTEHDNPRGLGRELQGKDKAAGAGVSAITGSSVSSRPRG